MNIEQAISAAKQATDAGKLTAPALANLTTWLTEARYHHYQPQIVEHISAGDWKKLDDVFWTVIPFGTGGRRGRMYAFGSNAINERTIGESAQGLANYILESLPSGKQLRCAIAYDTRHRSREFAELCASIMVANGFEVYFLDDYRATPQLSFAVREKKCDCGIMVTASHNPPSDNAVKVYWSTGGQVLPPHDKAIIDRVMNVDEIKKVDFESALADGKVKICTAEIDAAYLEAAAKFAWRVRATSRSFTHRFMALEHSLSCHCWPKPALSIAKCMLVTLNRAVISPTCLAMSAIPKTALSSTRLSPMRDRLAETLFLPPTPIAIAWAVLRR